MEEISVIDLLNRVVNKEKIPKKVKIINEIWYLVEKNTIQGSWDYQNADGEYLILELLASKYLTDILEIKVEIIEELEDKKIEKLTFDNTDVCCVDGLMKQSLNIKNTINEIIDRLNEMDKGE